MASPAVNATVAAEGRPLAPVRLVALGLFLLVLGGAGLTIAGWAADAAAVKQDFARATRFRPDLAIYHREYGEKLLSSRPSAALQQFQIALQRDRYDPVAAGDLTMAELATGADQQAWANEMHAAGSAHRFLDAWTLTNLALARHDNAEFWRELHAAALLANASYFASMDERVIAAMPDAYRGLRQSLPPESVPAAAAFLNTAVGHDNLAVAQEGMSWISSLHPTTASDYQLQQGAAIAYLTKAWQRWPGEVEPLWNQGRAADLFFGPDKDAGAHRVIDPDFDPDLDPDASGRAAAPVTSIMTWQVMPAVGVHRVLTGERRPASAAALDFEFSSPVSQALGVNTVLVQQPVLVHGGEHLAASATARLQGGGTLPGANETSHAVHLELLDGTGHIVADLPLTAGGSWTGSSADWAVPGQGLEAMQLAVAYRRPAGEPPLARIVYVTGVELEPAAK